MAGFAQVIKYEGDNETCIWKHEAEHGAAGTVV